MSHTKAGQQKRRTKAAPLLGAAGLSLSLASGASAAIGGANLGMDPAFSAVLTQQEMDEEEISDISLATFHVYDNESTRTLGWRTRPSMVSEGACGADLITLRTRQRLADQSIRHRYRPDLGRPVRRTNTNARNCAPRDTDRSNT